MRRIIQNTTAIAACLSLLAPYAAMAQTDATAEAAAAAAAEAEAAPEAMVETCEDGTQPPCAAPVEEVAPIEAEAAPEAVVEEVVPIEAEAVPAVEEITPEATAEPAADAAQDATNEAAEAAEAVEAPAAEVIEAPAATEAEAEATEPLAQALTKEAEATAAAAAEATAEAAAPAEVTTPAPEAEVVETEAAKEAAQVTELPAAAALSDEAGKGEVTEEQLTEDNTRSSSEDFSTALRDALAVSDAAPEAPQQAGAATDEDDDKDLTKALLLGLGGLAVGAMLTNNREVALSTPDRVVVTRADGSQQIIKDEIALLRQPGSTVTTENFDDGSSRSTVTRADGSKVVTIRDADLRVLRRTLVSADGTTTRLIDETAAQPVDLATLPAPAAAAQAEVSQMSEDDLRAALRAESGIDRRFSLAQIRDIAQVRSLVAPVNIDAITFDTGSAAINPDQAKNLAALGAVIRESIAANPGEVFLVEAYTDTVGSDAANLALSDRRAESVALALSEYFDVPPENLVVQGYGEQFLKVRAEGDIRENRRAALRRITGLLQQSQ